MAVSKASPKDIASISSTRISAKGANRPVSQESQVTNDAKQQTVPNLTLKVVFGRWTQDAVSTEG
ncbi:unnamed protein product, partial [Ixodes persulcatus]